MWINPTKAGGEDPDFDKGLKVDRTGLNRDANIHADLGNPGNSEVTPPQRTYRMAIMPNPW